MPEATASHTTSPSAATAKAISIGLKRLTKRSTSTDATLATPPPTGRRTTRALMITLPDFTPEHQ